MVAFAKPERLSLNAGNYPQWQKNGGVDKQNLPRIVHPSVYVLALEDGKYYVGLATHGCEFRIGEHCSNMGSKWTQIHKALHVIDFYYPASKKLEKELVLYYAHKYGAANVRGGPFCSTPPPAPMYPSPQRELMSSCDGDDDSDLDDSPTVAGCAGLVRTESVMHVPTNHDDVPARD